MEMVDSWLAGMALWLPSQDDWLYIDTELAAGEGSGEVLGFDCKEFARVLIIEGNICPCSDTCVGCLVTYVGVNALGNEGENLAPCTESSKASAGFQRV